MATKSTNNQDRTIQLNQKEQDLLQTVVDHNTLYMGSLAQVDNSPKVQDHLKTFEGIQDKLNS